MLIILALLASYQTTVDPWTLVGGSVATAIATTEAIHLPLGGDNSQPLLPQHQLLSLELSQGLVQLYLARGKRSACHAPRHLVVRE